MSAAPEKFSRIAAAFGCKDSNPVRAIDEVRNLIKKIGLPSTLSELGVTKAGLDEMAKKAMDDWCLKFNPKPVSESDMKMLYEKAF